MFIRFAIAGMLLFAQIGSPQAGTVTLDYSYFKERVQPIFLKKRPGHARCVVCHDHGIPALQPLKPGAAGWDEEQSQKNFAAWKSFTAPGNLLKSRILTHPLAKAAGGDRFHAGGRHWLSQNDPEWQTIAGWVRGEKLGGGQ